MSKYTLYLTKNNVDTITLPLYEKEQNAVLSDYFEKATDEYVYNDCLYNMYLCDDTKQTIEIESFFVNNEIIEDRYFLKGNKSLCIFLECFGFVKVEVVINGSSYVSNNIKVVMKEDSINNNIKNMIDYIYDNCDSYLYEEHKNSKSFFGINLNSNISIDTKLSLINSIYDIYVKSFNLFKHSAQTKLVTIEKIGNFHEMQSIKQDTINYIVNHPEELQPVDYDSGINVNKQYYQPQKTLVQSVAYSHDIYENQIVVGFLKTVVNDLNDIKNVVEERKKQLAAPFKKDGYIDSTYYVFSRNQKLLGDYIKTINENILKFQKLFLEYKKVLNVSDMAVLSQPKFTNMFRRIMPYNIIYQEIAKWFSCGNYDMTKSNLLLSFITISKIYEYFCLLKINESLKKCGYSLIDSIAFKYPENKYYKNTQYNNTFEFKKDNLSATVYFQPIIYGESRKRYNSINLFRATSISITYPTVFADQNEREPFHSNWYSPDYIVKISNNNEDRYFILDAKHSHPNDIERKQLPYLVFKYLFSINTLSADDSVDGLCILCGKTNNNSTTNIYDIAHELNISINPTANILCITGDDVNNNEPLENYFMQIEELFF